ncbi:MAG TPA: hypothetical protein EYP98_18520 [Planctomycetes bacterium]|nr:hypothetical protein [Planctomycetota bacterium]
MVAEEISVQEAKTLYDSRYEERIARIKTDVFYLDQFLDGCKILGGIGSLRNLLANIKEGQELHGLTLANRDPQLTSSMFEDVQTKIRMIEEVI